MKQETLMIHSTPIDDLWNFTRKKLIERAKFVAPISMQQMNFAELSREDLINLIRDWELESLKIVKSHRIGSRRLVDT